MKSFFYYVYFRLYKWSEKREPNFPEGIVLAWLSLTIFFNLCTFLSLVTIFAGIDAGSVFRVPRSGFAILLGFSAFGVVLWGLLKIFRVKERAFSPVLLEKYQQRAYRDWWIVVYFVVSLVAMALSAWVAGSKLGLH